MLKQLRWYWSRLKCMSSAEIGYRVKKTIYMRAQKSGYYLASEVPLPLTRSHGNPFIVMPVVSSEAYLHAATNVIEGHLPVFAIDDAELGSPPSWNTDPQSGIEAPLSFGKTLNYRDSDLVGDIKYLWEPNRHLQLVTLAQAYMLSEEQVYLDELREQLDSWFDQCPYMKGPNWTSSLELGIRLINWSLIWQMVGGDDSKMFKDEKGVAFRKRWTDSIYQHADFIFDHQSGYSSANNHLIGEVAGLFVAAVTWPYWPDECELWKKNAQEILEREALLQNASDGVNLEQAISYQQFVLDFLLIPAICGKANRIEFSDKYWERIELMLEYLASIMDVNGNIPMIGDADDGYVVRLSHERDWCPYHSLLATGAVLFKRGDFKIKAGHIDDKTLWLLGPGADSQFKSLDTGNVKLPVQQLFSEGGYYILGSNFETKNEIKLLLDAGPLGYQGIAAHGHADALNVYLSVGGTEFLIDPGTYAYHTQKKWRDYFRGTSAHNTIRIDQQDQSVSGGNFMWLDKAEATCEFYEIDDEQNRIIASHDGYQRLDDPVTHTREITLDSDTRQYIITDHISCKARHLVEQFWHFSEDCNVILDSRKLTVTNNGITIRISFDNQTDLNISMHEGEEDPPLGWVSRRYDYKSPATCVKVSLNIDVSTSLRTVIQCL